MSRPEGKTKAVRSLEDSHAQSLQLGHKWTTGRAVSGAKQHFFAWHIPYVKSGFQFPQTHKVELTEQLRWLRAQLFFTSLTWWLSPSSGGHYTSYLLCLCIWQLKMLILICTFVRGKQRERIALFSVIHFNIILSVDFQYFTAIRHVGMGGGGEKEFQEEQKKKGCHTK